MLHGLTARADLVVPVPGASATGSITASGALLQPTNKSVASRTTNSCGDFAVGLQVTDLWWIFPLFIVVIELLSRWPFYRGKPGSDPWI